MNNSLDKRPALYSPSDHASNINSEIGSNSNVSNAMLKAWTTLQTSGRDSEVLSRNNRHNNDENEPEESVEAIPDIVVVN